MKDGKKKERRKERTNKKGWKEGRKRKKEAIFIKRDWKRRLYIPNQPCYNVRFFLSERPNVDHRHIDRYISLPSCKVKY